jgi:hypothetical protein
MGSTAGAASPADLAGQGGEVGNRVPAERTRERGPEEGDRRHETSGQKRGDRPAS